MRPMAGVDTDIFFSWARNFTKETEFLRRNNNHLLLIMDGYSCHTSFKTLSLLKENNVVVVGLPAHTSHVLQPLDVGVFGLLKEEFRILVSLRTITTSTDACNDIFTICELLCIAFHKCVNGQKFIGRFRRSGLWSNEIRGADPSKITSNDLTSSTVRPECLSSIQNTRSVSSIAVDRNDREHVVETFKDLCELFKKRYKELISDGTVVENGTIAVTKTTGETLTRTNVINALEERTQHCIQEEEQSRQNAIIREQQAAEREQEHIQAAIRREERQRLAAERTSAREAHQQKILQLREERQRIAAERAHAHASQKQETAGQPNGTPGQCRESEAQHLRTRLATWLQASEKWNERRRKVRLMTSSRSQLGQSSEFTGSDEL